MIKGGPRDEAQTHHAQCAPGAACRRRIDACNSSLGGRAHRRPGRCPERTPDQASTPATSPTADSLTVTGTASPRRRRSDDRARVRHGRDQRLADRALHEGRTARSASRSSSASKQSGLVRAVGTRTTPPRRTRRCAGARRRRRLHRARRGRCRSRRASASAVARSTPSPVSRSTCGGGSSPSVAGRRVILEGRSGRHWHELATTRTGRHGGFRLRYGAGSLGRTSAQGPLHGRSAEHPRHPWRRPHHGVP